MKSAIHQAIEEGVIASLETPRGELFLPHRFTIEIDDAAFVLLLRHLVDPRTQQPLSPQLKRVELTIAGYKVIVRSDRDPDSWPIDGGPH